MAGWCTRARREPRKVLRSRRCSATSCLTTEQRLKLRVNREKSVVARALRRPFLGFGFLPRMGEVRVLVDPNARTRAKDRLRALTSRRWGVSMERRIEEINRFTVGWTAYFSLADTRPRSRISTNGSGADYGKCDGRSGSAPARGGATCERAISLRRPPVNGRPRVRDTGA
jgi:Group II intron, maturase-specific domain